MVKYSIATSDLTLLSSDRVEKWLIEGVKILAFAPSKHLEKFENRFKNFKTIRLLQLYYTEASIPSFTVYDGIRDQVQESALHEVSEICTEFNLEQYQVEHAPVGRSLIIEAGAGTGKTTVMIDRIMFLVHTTPHISMEDIAMITFTNDATQNMRHKVQNELLNRYKATKNPKYVRILEDESKMRTHTIHSFSKDIIAELGLEMGYSTKLKLRSFKYEKKQLIYDALDNYTTSPHARVDKSLGLVLHKLANTLLSFWTSMENIGLSDEEVSCLDWGRAEDHKSEALHNTVESIFAELNERYNKLKQRFDAIAVSDIVRELRRIIEENSNSVIKSRSIKYLFVDEFQDSDNAQIKTIVWLMKIWGFQLFAVGDIKQSIYRFRGAIATAFKKLCDEMRDAGFDKPETYSLIKNYRTSKDILNKLDPIFRDWGKDRLLEYKEGLFAQKQFSGTFQVHRIFPWDNIRKKVVISILRDCLNDCITEAKRSGTENESFQHVTVLTRTNAELKKIAEWCMENHIPCYIKTEGGLFASKAVRDFMAMISAYVFTGTAVYKYNYLMSPYGPGVCNIESLASYDGDGHEQNQYLDELLNYASWQSNKRAFRLRPALSVLRDIIEAAEPVQKFMTIRKAELLSIGVDWDDNELNEQVFIEAKQYERNTEKLMQNIRDHFSGDTASLYQVYRYLLLNIQTNRDIDEPEILEHVGCNCVYGMTVHKAKGLEFDTVVIPFTDRKYRRDIETEIIIDDHTKRAGWCYAEYQNYQTLSNRKSNSYYNEFVETEFKATDEEEARLLYVAMTRSIRKLICLKADLKEGTHHTWSGLLEGYNG